ncbi:GNAT family N-acetyltransferase [candidate division KSB1 bacterium]|nr:GNAT family N-acetyltransferase [candidate division KSB1 bacterium]
MPETDFKMYPIEGDPTRVTELFARCFAHHNSYYSHLRRMDLDLRKNPCMKPDDCWVIEKEGAIIGLVLVSVMPLRVGSSLLLAGGIGGVCTELPYRKMGYNQKLMKRCIAFMTERGLDISLLAGIENYYHQYGYAVVMPGYTLSVASQAAIEKTGSYSVRKFTDTDLPSLIMLYEREYGSLTGTHARSKDFWQWLISNSPEIIVAVDSDERVKGYIWLDSGKETKLREAAADDVPAVHSLMHFAALQAREKFQAAISGYLHPRQPFARTIISETGCEVKMHHPRNGGWMARCINLSGMFEKLTTEFSQRLSESQFYNWNGSIKFVTDLGTVALRGRDGGIVMDEPGNAADNVVCKVNQSVLMQMIFGYVTLSELIRTNKISIDDGSLPLLNALFPFQQAFISAPDHF